MADAKLLQIGGVLENYAGSSIAVATRLTDAANDWTAWSFCVHEAGSIGSVGLMITAITGAPGTLVVGLQGLNASGNPDGTWKQNGGNDCKKTVAYTDLTADLWNWITLDYSYTASLGEYLAIVVQTGTGTYDASNNYTFNLNADGPTTRPAHPNSTISSDGGAAWAKQTTGYPIYGYKVGSNPHGFPVRASSQTTYVSTSTYDEYGLRFLLDAGFGSTFKVAGFRVAMYTPPSAKTFTVRLATTDGTELASITVDSDVLTTASSQNRLAEFYFTGTLPTLDFGTAYVLSMESLSSTTNLGIQYVSVESNSDLDALPAGKEWYRAKRADHTGSFTLEDNIRPLITPIITDWTEPPTPITVQIADINASF